MDGCWGTAPLTESPLAPNDWQLSEGEGRKSGEDGALTLLASNVQGGITMYWGE